MSGGPDDLVATVRGGAASGGLGEILGGLAGGSQGDSGLGDILGGILGGGGLPSGEDVEGSTGLGGMLTTLLPMVGSLLAGDGLQRILAGMQANGLSAQTDSWLGTGENEPLSGAAVRQALGDDEIGRIAQKLGLSEHDAAEAVAQVLPVVIDRVSPDGRLAPPEKLGAAFAALEQLGE